MYSTLKRAADIAIITITCPLWAPILLIVWAGVRLTLGAPTLFRQTRVGFQEKPFTMIKFRTMSNKVDSNGTPLPDNQRLSRFGKWLRATSLDELPELFNVLKGEMSLVGPRPLLPEYIPYYTPSQRRRHSVKPGLTGWAQINGRNSISWERKFELDIEYVDNASLAFDLRILMATAWSVLNKQGITHSETETMPKFTITQSSASIGKGDSIQTSEIKN